MSTEFRRFEILLPLQFNDGKPVPDELIVNVELELEKQFGSISAETQVIRGRWQSEGHSYRDNLVRIFVDVLIPKRIANFSAITRNSSNSDFSKRTFGLHPTRLMFTK